MRWDWQIGRTTPLQRTGRNAVDIYDIDGFLTTRAQVTAIKTRWQASTLTHPRTACYLDLAWEDYRPDATPGTDFPAGTLGNIYFGFPEERWVDLRQLGALEPMLRERVAMCARKGFDAVELDDIDSFDPPSTTGFRLTPGDVQNFLEDGYVCSPGQKCTGPHSFGTFCRSVFAVPHGYAAVRFDVDLDGKIFYPCRE